MLPSRPRRSARTVGGLLALAALVLSAALPASGLGAAGMSLAYLNQPTVSQPVRPVSLHVASYSPSGGDVIAFSTVANVSWSAWGGAIARGAGTATISWGPKNGTEEHHLSQAAIPVDVTATGLQRCGGFTVYTALEIEPAAGVEAPPYFAQVQHDEEVHRCRVRADSYYKGEPEERRLPFGACDYRGLHEGTGINLRYGETNVFCAMRWNSWGAPTTAGIGIAEVSGRLYAARVALSRIRWCLNWTVAYTQETVQLWGAGVRNPDTFRDGVPYLSPRTVTELTTAIGRSGEHYRTLHYAAACPAPTAARGAARLATLKSSKDAIGHHQRKPGIWLSGPLTNVSLDTDYTYNVEVVSAKSYRHALVRLDVLPSNCFIPTVVNVVAGQVWRKSYTVAFLSTYMMSTDGLDIGLFAPPSEYGHLLLGKPYPVTPAAGQVPNPSYSAAPCSNPLFGS